MTKRRRRRSAPRAGASTRAPRARNATMSGAVAATTIMLASLATMLRQIAQTAATTQTAASARANSATPSRQVEIAVVRANTKRQRRPENARGAQPCAGRPRASQAPRRARALNQERSRKADTAMSAAGRTIPSRSERVGAAPPKRPERQNDDPVDIGAKPRQRAVLLAQERRIEVGLRRCRAGRRAASGDCVEATRRHWPFA